MPVPVPCLVDSQSPRVGEMSDRRLGPTKKQDCIRKDRCFRSTHTNSFEERFSSSSSISDIFHTRIFRTTYVDLDIHGKVQMQRCNFPPFYAFTRKKPSPVNFQRVGRENDAFLSSLEIDRSRCGVMHSGVVSLSSFVPISPPLGMRRTAYCVFLLILFFFCFFTTLHSYHSGCDDGNWTSILAYFYPCRVGKSLREQIYI